MSDIQINDRDIQASQELFNILVDVITGNEVRQNENLLATVLGSLLHYRASRSSDPHWYINIVYAIAHQNLVVDGIAPKGLDEDTK